ncbi:MAG: hypothetical protein R3E66_07655 [bacterium]
MKRLLVGLILLSGCATAPPPSAPPQPTGGMMGLEAEPDRSPWRKQEPQAMQDRPDLKEWVAFDARGVRDPETRELVWQAVAAVLAGLNDPAAVMAQAELEPGPSSAWNLYFLVDGTSEREAVLWRFSRAKSPGDLVLNVMVARGGGDESIVMWLSTGVNAPSSRSWQWVRPNGDCELRSDEGLVFPKTPIQDAACAVSYSVLKSVLLDVQSGSAYLSAPDAQTPTDHWPADLVRRDRQINEVFSDSVFPPRMTF